MKPSLFCIVAITIALSSTCDGKVMMEYIGDSYRPISMENVPIDPKIDFHFILGFALDANSTGESQNGVFYPYWSPTLTRASIHSVKAHHPNVKVLMGIFGDIFSNSDNSWYNPHNREAWITNAFNSIKSLVRKYHLNGIDVDYEAFPKKDTSFVYCIGQLITRLKNRRVITVATISPTYATAERYIRLYRRYPTVIDYVNYQFATDKGTSSPWTYLRFYKLRATQFHAPKLLPYYEVSGTGIRRDAFFEALRLLESSGFQVNGLVLYSADSSKSHGFYYEKKFQAFLLGGNTTFLW